MRKHAGNKVDGTKNSQNNNSCDLQAEANMHTKDVTAKSNSLPMRPINCLVKEALETTPASTKTSQIYPDLPQFNVRPSEINAKMWGNVSHQSFCDEINKIYNEVVHLRRNIFNLPSGRAGKQFIKELIFWLR